MIIIDDEVAIHEIDGEPRHKSVSWLMAIVRSLN